MPTKPLITAERLREVLDYDPETGIFRWRARSDATHMKAGDEAGTLSGPPRSRYTVIVIDGRSYKAQRLAWLYVKGEWPSEKVDHRNGITTENRFSNLREATHAQNARNARTYKNNALGMKGIRRKGNKFQVRITQDKLCICLGSFDTLNEAISVRRAAAGELHGEFAHHS